MSTGKQKTLKKVAMALGLQRLSQRAGDGNGENLLDSAAGEELLLVLPAVAVALGRRRPESPGTLVISTKRVMWLSDSDKSKGYAVDFLDISLHAVARDPEVYPHPCIYARIDTEEGAESDDSDSEFVDNVELSRVTEMRLVPSDPSQLDILFDIFSYCIDLNPEPNEDGDEENSWIFGDEDMRDGVIGYDSELQFLEDIADPIGYPNGSHDLGRRVCELQINDLGFEDAEEMEQGPGASCQ